MASVGIKKSKFTCLPVVIILEQGGIMITIQYVLDNTGLIFLSIPFFFFVLILENESAVNTLAPPKTETSADTSADPTDLLPPAKPVEQQQKQRTEEGSSEAELVSANPDTFDVMPNVKVEPDMPVASGSPSTTVAGTDSPSAAPTAETDTPSAAGTGPAYGKKPYYPSGMQTAVSFGPGHPSLPFFLEFFQPYGQIGAAHQKQPPFRHQQQPPFGAPIVPFDPFASAPAQLSPFHQLVEAYTNEFRSKWALLRTVAAVRDGSRFVSPITAERVRERRSGVCYTRQHTHTHAHEPKGPGLKTMTAQGQTRSFF